PGRIGSCQRSRASPGPSVAQRRCRSRRERASPSGLIIDGLRSTGAATVAGHDFTRRGGELVTEPDATMIMIGRVWGAQARFHRPGDISVASGSPTSEHPLDDAGVEEVLGAEDLPGADLGVVGAATP